ncbi:hypothetical protein LUZ62_021252 [Rhynchospora pubera]|uniref:F-box domain-containing protein n=1 Tax=Rhynchospora pubera TaxID=906938 RepID=A0AAV8GXU6_9POAL|nr:hypothetical protein LUZ62_021252 [Rhynchospora pubera]
MPAVDRLSNLPDVPLLHIMSFLTTKDVVTNTCTLSKRWENFWTGATCLIFDSHEFNDDLKFMNFVDNVLAKRQNLNLDTFKLVWNNNTSTFEAAESWLAHAVKAKPRVLILIISGDDVYLEFSDDVFMCESLEELKLSTTFSGGFYPLKPKSVKLNGLKKLEISHDINLDDDFMKKLMGGSPILEELILDCEFEGLSIISSQSVKKLILYCHATDKFQISIPSLLSLYIENAVPGRISCKNLVSLVEACISVDCCLYDGSGTLLNGLSNAEELHFDNISSVAMFEKELPNCPTFYNLKEMNCHVDSFYPVARFLQHAPNLEKLTLRYYFELKCDSYYRHESDVYFSCEKLKMVEICYACPEEARDGMKLLSYNEDMPNNVELKLTRL